MQRLSNGMCCLSYGVLYRSYSLIRQTVGLQLLIACYLAQALLDLTD